MDPRFREDDEYWGQVHQRGLDCPVGARLDVPFWKTGDRLPSFPTHKPSFLILPFVIPAKAGIQHTIRHSRHRPGIHCMEGVDPRFREDDEKGAGRTHKGFAGGDE